jgi:hypothetical protein
MVQIKEQYMVWYKIDSPLVQTKKNDIRSFDKHYDPSSMPSSIGLSFLLLLDRGRASRRILTYWLVRPVQVLPSLELFLVHAELEHLIATRAETDR